MCRQGPLFGSDSRKIQGLRESLCELRPILSKMARARSTINLETEWGSHRALGGEGLSACSGDILLESLVACAGVTLGEIAKAMEADSGVMLPMKYWEIIADKLSAAGWSWGCVSAVDSRGQTMPRNTTQTLERRYD